jgi:acyl carrier protein
MATQLDLISHFESHGLFPMTTAQGLQAMGQLTGERAAQAVVIAADWGRVADVNFLGHPPAMLERVVRESAVSGDAARGTEQHGSGDFLLQYSAEPEANERRALLERHLTELACRVLRIDEKTLGPADSLNSRGLDSLMAIELKTRIETSTRLTITIVELLRGGSVSDVADRLLPDLEQHCHADLEEEVAAILRDAEVASAADLVALLQDESLGDAVNIS